VVDVKFVACRHTFTDEFPTQSHINPKPR